MSFKLESIIKKYSQNNKKIEIFKDINNETNLNNLIKSINNYLDKGITVILLVPNKFNFDYLVKNSKANSIDAISWREHNIKSKNYIIVIDPIYQYI